MAQQVVDLFFAENTVFFFVQLYVARRVFQLF